MVSRRPYRSRRRADRRRFRRAYTLTSRCRHGAAPHYAARHAGAVRQHPAAENAGRTRARTTGDRRGNVGRARAAARRFRHLDHGKSAVQHVARRARHARLRAPAAPVAGSCRHRLSGRHAAAIRRCDGCRLSPRHAGSDRLRVRRAFVLGLRAAGPRRRPLRHARPLLAPLCAVEPLSVALHREHAGLARARTSWPRGRRLADPQTACF